ncbi:hydroxyacylglutathione hydrolase [Shewanella sp. UCD-KL12]|uniref:hydroxyacylglutathione hydrolase n=1 Tax=Shewanella sp. UCD-KL12 TaxID=1917163 RepID=UPI000970C208|nr:hydroxyacylglutathione hydrolase [Shewanella sp. UCD-KL12]
MQTKDSVKLTINPLAVFNDNYIWVIACENNKAVYVVDPGDGEAVIEYLTNNNLSLAGVLITHHHNDHTGGVTKLIEHAQTSVEIYGPEKEGINGVNKPISNQKSILLKAFNLSAEVIQLPGHTLGHIGYLIDSNLFCGDTLFSGGCGRIFEGTAEQMHESLSRLSQLPADTQVYCAHEYTLDNLKFALAVEPSNLNLQDYYSLCLNKRQQRIATIPSSIAIERNINPFLRCNIDTVASSVNQHFGTNNSDPQQVFTLLRQWKDNF